MLTYEQSPYRVDERGNMQGQLFERPYRTHDGRTVDSTGAFLVGELERLDQKLHQPLVATTWSRDIDMRSDATIADEVSSFTISTFGSPGGLGTGNAIGTGKAWMGKETTQISGISLDIAKIPHPLRLWALEVKYTIPELESAAKLGRPVDDQKVAGLNQKHQMDVDEQVYYGDTIYGDTGLINASLVTNTASVAVGALGSTLWANKTPNEILADVNEVLVSDWAATGYALMANRLLLPPAQFGFISTEPVTAAGSGSILKYLLENNVNRQSAGSNIEIYPVKWLPGAGSGGTIGTISVDRMVAYRKEYDRVRFPMTALARTAIQFDGIFQKFTYYGRIGVLEAVYPETLAYRDGI